MEPLHPTERVDTLIVGAGLSGIYAAYLLSRRKESFVVLEGRQRIGGRILSREHQGLFPDHSDEHCDEHQVHFPDNRVQPHCQLGVVVSSVSFSAPLGRQLRVGVSSASLSM